MTITQKFEVEGDSNEYKTRAAAELAEFYINLNAGIYIDARQRKLLFKAITEAFLLVPIIPTTTTQITQAELDAFEAEINIDGSKQAALDQRELDSYGPSA